MKIEDKIKEGHGQGDGKNYKPWIKVSDFSSLGTSSRVMGIKTKREHHLFSHFESHYFLILDLSDNVVDIKEQFPLLDLEETESIAKNLGIVHPSHNSQNIVLTTDFLIKTTDGNRIARTFKMLKDVDARQLEKFEIERNYWLNRNVDWGLVTELDMPSKDYILNLKDMHYAYRTIKGGNANKEQLLKYFDFIRENYTPDQNISLVEFANHLDKKGNLERGTIFQIIKFLIAIKAIKCSLDILLSSRNLLLSDIKIDFVRNELSSKSDLAA